MHFLKKVFASKPDLEGFFSPHLGLHVFKDHYGSFCKFNEGIVGNGRSLSPVLQLKMACC